MKHVKLRAMIAVCVVAFPAVAAAQPGARVRELFGPRGVTDGAIICWDGTDGAHGKNCTGDTLAYVAPYPKKAVPLRAVSGYCKTTNGCTTPSQTETTTNKINYGAAIFADDSTTCWQIDTRLPKNYVDGSTFTAEVSWIPDDDTTSGSVVWSVAAGAIRDQGTIDSALGTPVQIVDAWGAAGKLHVSGTSGAITAAGSPVGGDHIWVETCRVGGDGSDDLAGGASDNANLLTTYLIFSVDKLSTED